MLYTGRHSMDTDAVDELSLFVVWTQPLTGQGGGANKGDQHPPPPVLSATLLRESGVGSGSCWSFQNPDIMAVPPSPQGFA